jgi:hypothetical protein
MVYCSVDSTSAQNITLGLELNAAGTEYVAMPYYSVKLFPTN